MTERIVARLVCSGCLEELRVDVADIRVERGCCYFECRTCGPSKRRLTEDEWRALALLDRPGGTMVSEREVLMFRLRARRLERFLEAEGLTV